MNGDSAKIRAAIGEENCIYSRKMALQPCEILLRSRRVYDQQKFLLANSINNQVINDATTLVQQKRVLPGSNIELADVICQCGVKPFARACRRQCRCVAST